MLKVRGLGLAATTAARGVRGRVAGPNPGLASASKWMAAASSLFAGDRIIAHGRDACALADGPTSDRARFGLRGR